MIALTSLERSDSAQRSISWRIWARSLALFFTGMIVSFISPWAVSAYCARHLLAVDGMVLQRSLFLSSVTTGGRSVQGILIAIMMADPVHKRAVAPASSSRAFGQSSRDTILGRSMLLELSTLLMIRLL